MGGKSLKLLGASLSLGLLLFGGFWIYDANLKTIQSRVQKQLKDIATLKVERITSWRSERLADGELLRNNPLLSEWIRDWLVQGGRKESMPSFRDYLLALRTQVDFRAALVVDAKGQIRFGLGAEASGVLDDPEQSALVEAIRTHRVILSDLSVGSLLNFPHLSIVVPLFQGETPMGAIFLIVDAREKLFSLVQSWPSSSPSAESVLVRRDGDSALILTDTRLQSNIGLNLRLPLNRADLPLMQAFAGKTGLIDARDYRDVPVVSIVFQIPDTGWWLVTKIDEQEIYQGLRRKALTYVIASLGGLLALLGFGFLVWQMSRQVHLSKVMEAEAAQLVSDKRFHTLFEDMPDPAWIVYKNRFIEANQAALKAIGCESRRDFMSLHPSEVSPDFQPDGQSSFAKSERIMADMLTQTHMRFEWVHKRRDGSHFPVEVTLTRIEWEGEPAIYCIWRDISDRQRMQEDLLATESRLKSVFENTYDAIMLLSNGRFIDGNPKALELFGLASKQELIGRHYLDLSPPCQAGGKASSEASEVFMEQVTEVGHCVFEWLYRRKDGSEFLAEVMWSVIPLGNESILQSTVRDITGRKQIEMQLKTFAEIINSSSDAIIAKTLDGVITSWNPAAEMIFGYSALEMIGQSVTKLFPPDRLVEEAGFMEHVAQGQTVSHFETVRRHKDGHDIQVSITLSPILDEKGALIGISKIARDITERKQAELSMRRIEYSINHSPDALFWVRSDGRFVDVNAAACQLLGYSHEALLELSVPEIDPLLPHSAWLAMWERVVNEKTVRIESMNRARDGREYPVEISASYIIFDDQPLICSFVREISERRAIERQLEEYRLNLEQLVQARTLELKHTADRLHYAMEATHDGVWDWNIKDGKIYCNAAYFRMLGYEQDEFGHSETVWVELLYPEDKEAAVEAAKRLLADPGHYELQFRMCTKTGGYRWILSRGRTVERDCLGLPVRAVGTHLDMTERMEHQLELQRSEQRYRDLNASLEQKVEERTLELKASSTAKSQFLAHMSHEIRTPMNAILGLTQLMEKESLPTEQRVMIRHIREAGDSLLHIINDILDLSKIEAGQVSIDLQPLTLTPLLDHLDRLFRLSAESKGLAFVINPPAQHLGTFIGDPVRLQQVLINLLSNAIKFTEQGVVSLSVVSLENNDVSVRLRFEVQDTGIGIAEEVLSKLFQPFIQADASITRRYGGTGLGLVISRKLLELMGGTLGATSVPGQGSLFWFELPLKRFSEPVIDDVPAEAQVVQSPGPQLTGLKVLAVDDSRINLMVVERALKLEGAHVTLAADGQQALQILQAQPEGFDVVLMDIQMPVMDGLTATRLIHQVPGLEQLPVIALTAGVLPEEREEAMRAGVIDFLAKPIDLSQLAPLLERYLPTGESRAVDQ